MIETPSTSAYCPPAPLLHGFHAVGRQREPEVERQIVTLLGLSAPEVARRTRSGQPKTAAWIHEESLVALLRVRRRQNDTQAVEQILELLIERTARFIWRHVACWHLAPQHVDECIRDVQMRMVEDVFSDSPKTEFYEVRFLLCLKRALINIVKKYRVLSQAQVPLQVADNDESGEYDKLDTLVVAEDLTMQQRLEMSDALAALPERERIAFVLFYRDEIPQDRIAAHLQVTDRTVRNLLRSAQQKMTEWYGGRLH